MMDLTFLLRLGDKTSRFNMHEISGFRSQAHKSRLLYIKTNKGFVTFFNNNLITGFLIMSLTDGEEKRVRFW